MQANPGLEPTARIENEMRSNDPSFPTLPELPTSAVSSRIRKAQVRAALFQKKVDPVKIGRFTLLERLGAGAMGEIYAAYDDQLDRKVALKLVRHGSNPTSKADDLLLREAQALAHISHPNVVQIYEAGAHDGRLFIAMELIRGQTLTGWLDDAARMPRRHRQREVLRQFIAAGRGLEAAHTAGVAHRDFKPDNVVVGKNGRVCVVDFGLARVLVDDPTLRLPARASSDDPAAAEAMLCHGETVPLDLASTPSPGAAAAASELPKLTAATRLTRTGTVMGTPRFMAPEQIRGGVPDHRSDQFSFCVALYHALYGAFPFSGQHPRELLDSIETGVSGLEHSVGLGARLRKALCRGLSVDPSQRFPSMGELLAALEPGLRRRWEWVAGAVLLFLVVAAVWLWPARVEDPCARSGGAIAALWSAERRDAIHDAFTRSGLPYADAAWQGASQRIDDYAGRWRDEARAACRATYIDHTRSEPQFDRRMLCLERGTRQVEALAHELSGATAGAVQHAVEAAEGLPDLSACSRTEAMLFGLAPPPPSAAHEIEDLRRQLARALQLERLGNTELSLAVASEARIAAERQSYRPVHAEALFQVARVVDRKQNAGARGEAESLYFEALDIAEAERHDELAAAIWDRLLLLTLRMDAGSERARERWRRSAAAVARIGDSAADQAQLHYQLSEIYLREGKYAEAAEAANRAIAAISDARDQQLVLFRYYEGLAKPLEVMGRIDEAISLHERALDIARANLGPSHPDLLLLQMNFAKTLMKQGRLPRAREMLEAALTSMPPKYRDSSLDAGLLHTFLSDVSYTEGKLDEAAAHGREALDIYQRVGAPDTNRAEALTNIANAEMKRKNFAAALSRFEDALALRRAHLGKDNYSIQLGVNEGSIAEVLVALGRYDAAMTHIREAERIFDHGSARDPGTQAWVLTVKGEVLVNQDQASDAVTVLERALPLFDAAPDPTNQALATWYLARALHDLGREPDRVRQLAEKARMLFTTLGAAQTRNRDDVVQFIERLSPGRRPSMSNPSRTLTR